MSHPRTTVSAPTRARTLYHDARMNLLNRRQILNSVQDSEAALVWFQAYDKASVRFIPSFFPPVHSHLLGRAV